MLLQHLHHIKQVLTMLHFHHQLVKLNLSVTHVENQVIIHLNVLIKQLLHQLLLLLLHHLLVLAAELVHLVRAHRALGPADDGGLLGDQGRIDAAQRVVRHLLQVVQRVALGGGLLERMQTPAARQGMEAAFNASPAELGQAAANAARRRR